MKCKKCGSINSEFNIICENCGAPLDIENNTVLKELYNNKQKAIDIEELKVDRSDALFRKTKKKVKRVIIFLTLILLCTIGVFSYNIYKDHKSSDVLNQFDKFIENNNIGIIYIGKDKKGNKYLEDKTKEYEYNYLYIDNKKLTRFKKKQIQRKLKINRIDSTVVVVENKKMEYYYHNFSSKNVKDLEDFLGKNDIFPKLLSDSASIIKKFDENLKSEDPLIIYMVNHENNKVQESSSSLKKFANIIQ